MLNFGGVTQLVRNWGELMKSVQGSLRTFKPDIALRSAKIRGGDRLPPTCPTCPINAMGAISDQGLMQNKRPTWGFRVTLLKLTTNPVKKKHNSLKNHPRWFGLISLKCFFCRKKSTPSTLRRPETCQTS